MPRENGSESGPTLGGSGRRAVEDSFEGTEIAGGLAFPLQNEPSPNPVPPKLEKIESLHFFTCLPRSAALPNLLAAKTARRHPKRGFWRISLPFVARSWPAMARRMGIFTGLPMA